MYIPTILNSFTLKSVIGEGNGTPLQYSCLENPMDGGAWKAAVHGVAEGRTRLSDFTFTFQFYALEKEMATHSSVFVWRIPGTGEPGGLPSMGSHRVGHDWSDLAIATVIDPEALELTMCLSFQLFNLLIDWRLPVVGFSTSKKGLSSALQLPSPTKIICETSSWWHLTILRWTDVTMDIM